jgi:hypothetical protein
MGSIQGVTGRLRENYWTNKFKNTIKKQLAVRVNLEHYEPVGRRFESFRARHQIKGVAGFRAYLFSYCKHLVSGAPDHAEQGWTARRAGDHRSG